MSKKVIVIICTVIASVLIVGFFIASLTNPELAMKILFILMMAPLLAMLVWAFYNIFYLIIIGDPDEESE